MTEAGTKTAARQWRELAALVAAFWLAVFAHIGVTLLWSGMAVAAVLLHRRTLLGARRALAVALGLCALAPVAFVATSTWGGAAGAASGRDEPGPLPVGSFLGDHLVNLRSVLHPDPAAWTALFGVGALRGIVPWLVFLLSALLGLLAVRAFLVTTGTPGAPVRWRAITAMLLLYWVPVLAFAAVTTAGRARYLLFLQPLGYVLVAAAVALPWISPTRHGADSRLTHLLRAAAVGLALVLVIHLADGLRQLDDLAVSEGAVANRVEALVFVAAHHAPGDPILVSWPPDAYLMLSDRPEIRALGPLPTGRATLGEKSDFWVGWPVIDAGKDPCALLADHPGAWFVLEPYLGSSSVLREVTEGMEGLAFARFGAADVNSTLVLHTPSDRSLLRKAVKDCRRDLRATEGL
jgi:hypothetical protein